MHILENVLHKPNIQPTMKCHSYVLGFIYCRSLGTKMFCKIFFAMKFKCINVFLLWNYLFRNFTEMHSGVCLKFVHKMSGIIILYTIYLSNQLVTIFSLGVKGMACPATKQAVWISLVCRDGGSLIVMTICSTHHINVGGYQIQTILVRNT